MAWGQEKQEKLGKCEKQGKSNGKLLNFLKHRFSNVGLRVVQLENTNTVGGYASESSVQTCDTRIVILEYLL